MVINRIRYNDVNCKSGRIVIECEMTSHYERSELVEEPTLVKRRCEMITN